MWKSILQGLRLLFMMMLFFGVFFRFSGQPKGFYTSVYEFTLIGVGGVGSLLMWAFALGKPNPAETRFTGRCPECGEALPSVRVPTNRRQMLWGGWTCKKCGCEIDKTGKKVVEQ
jgi:hypothetical protein